jgi:hypothetical protein
MSMRAALCAAAALLLAGCPESLPAPITTTDAGDAATEAGTRSWQVVLQKLDGALLSVWGTSGTDVYAVGGPHGNAGFNALVMHFDGATWTRLDAGNTDTYWWVYGTGAKDVWMTGENGRISHWDGATFKHYASGTTATIFGVYAASATDVWAVGGTPEATSGQPNDVLLHFDGAAWTPSPLPKTLGRTYFKVWGSGPEDVWVVGEAGTIWHRTGGAWTLASDPPVAHGTLLTVNGCAPNDVYAVGSRDVLHYDGAAWKAEPVTLLNDVNGVSCGTRAGANEVLIVGFGGLKQRREGGVWIDDFGTPPFKDLHGAWVDPSGGLWGAGGDFVAQPQPNVTRDGVLAHYGDAQIPTTIAP